MNERELRHDANRLVLAMVGGDKELAEKWWTNYNRHFAQTPDETWKIDHDRVMLYLYSIDNYY